MCQWAGVTQSKRLDAASTLTSAIGAIEAEPTNAQCVRRLASLKAAPGFSELGTLVASLASELDGVRDLKNGQSPFTTVSTHGTEAERVAVVKRLQNLLGDAISTQPLHSAAEAWNEVASATMVAVLKRLERTPDTHVVELPAAKGSAALEAATAAIGAELTKLGDRKVTIRIQITAVDK